jgi:hypothetical protein
VASNLTRVRPRTVEQALEKIRELGRLLALLDVRTHQLDDERELGLMRD